MIPHTPRVTAGSDLVSLFRCILRHDSNQRATLALVLVASLGALAAPGMLRSGAARAVRVAEGSAAGSAMESFLPHLVSGGFTTPVTPTPFGTPPGPTPWPTWPSRPTRPPRPRMAEPIDAVATHVPNPDGMVSFGESVLELQNLTDRDLTIDLDLHSLNQFDDLALTRDLAPVAAISVELKTEPDVTYSEYAARLRADGAFGSLARTSWMSEAMAAYEVPEPATESILPIFALEVYSHTTFLQLTNTSPGSSDDITMQVYDSDGSVLCEWSFGLGPGESGAVDPYERAEFSVLPGNVGDGFLGAVRFRSTRDTAIVAYGDEWEGRGVTAFRARPVSASASEQYLPVIRAGVGGDSLIAVANATGKANNVAVTYHGSAHSPSGAGQTFRQEITVGPWRSAVIDLDLERHRGNVAPPDLPRGTKPDGGFLGSAVVTASAGVLTTVLEQEASPLGPPNAYTVLTSAAYDGFGYSDLSSAWIVPRVYDGSLGRFTEVAVMNPRARPVTLRVEWGRLPDGLVGSSGPITLPAEEATVIAIPTGAGLDAQALIRADAPIAALVRDLGSELDTTAYWPIPAMDTLVDALPTVVPPATAAPSATTPSTVATATARTATATSRPGTYDVYLPSARRR